MALRGITSPTLSGTFLPPDSQDVDPMRSYELGGVALNDPSQGREVQTWVCYLDGGVVKVSPLSGAPVTDVFTPAGEITALSLAFDSNMVPTIAYVEAGLVKLRWFNTLTSLVQTDVFAGATECKAATDEKRPGLEGLSDVIFAYVRGATLYYRQQRDRYLVEYTVGAVPVGYHLRRIGKHDGYRFQFELST